MNYENFEILEYFYGLDNIDIIRNVVRELENSKFDKRKYSKKYFGQIINAEKSDFFSTYEPNRLNSWIDFNPDIFKDENFNQQLKDRFYEDIYKAISNSILNDLYLEMVVTILYWNNINFRISYNSNDTIRLTIISYFRLLNNLDTRKAKLKKIMNSNE